MKKFTKILKTTFLIITAIITVTPTYAALPSDDVLDMYNKNGIYYYNPEGSADNCNTSSTTLAGSDTAEKIWNFLCLIISKSTFAKFNVYGTQWEVLFDVLQTVKR